MIVEELRTIPFTLTYFREARDIGRQWAIDRFAQEREHTRSSLIFDARWVEFNARTLLGLEPEDIEDYDNAREWVHDLTAVISRTATREYKKLAEGQMR